MCVALFIGKDIHLVRLSLKHNSYMGKKEIHSFGLHSIRYALPFSIHLCSAALMQYYFFFCTIRESLLVTVKYG